MSMVLRKLMIWELMEYEFDIDGKPQKLTIEVRDQNGNIVPLDMDLHRYVFTDFKLTCKDISCASCPFFKRCSNYDNSLIFNVLTYINKLAFIHNIYAIFGEIYIIYTGKRSLLIICLLY